MNHAEYICQKLSCDDVVCKPEDLASGFDITDNMLNQIPESAIPMSDEFYDPFEIPEGCESVGVHVVGDLLHLVFSNCDGHVVVLTRFTFMLQ